MLKGMMMKPRLNLGMLLCMLSCLVAAGADGPKADEVKANEAKDKAPEQAGMDWAATAAMAGPGQHHEHLERIDRSRIPQEQDENRDCAKR